jgi:hypothetical protein
MIKYTATNSQGRLEPGVHFVRVKSAVEGVSNKGDQTIEMELDIAGHGMRDTLYNSERAAWRITQARACFGFDDTIGDEIEFAAADLVGCTGNVEIALGAPKSGGKYEGKSFLEIKKYLPRDEVSKSKPGTQVDDDDNIPF